MNTQYILFKELEISYDSSFIIKHHFKKVQNLLIRT
jgi:hypothetical protein